MFAGKKSILLSCIVLLIWSSTMGDVSASRKMRSEYEKTGEVVWDIQTKEKVIALTFDDGPHPVYTKEILDLLSQYDAKATFFIVGSRVEKYADIVVRQVQEGHELANHTYTHCNLRQITPEKLKEELSQTKEVVQRITGVPLTLFRPVGGYYSDEIINTAFEEGYRTILWSWYQDSKDWRRPGAQKIINNVLNDARPGDIILFHDGGGKRNQTVKALKTILPALKNEGYTLVTVSELMQRSEHMKIPLEF